MIKIKKIVTKGFASLAALTMLNIGIAPAAYAHPAWDYDPEHPCAQYGEYNVEKPETWRQGSGKDHGGPNFLNEPYNRRVPKPCDDMFETNKDGSKRRSNFQDAGCGTHTWANLMLKTGMAQKGYAAFDAGHYFSCPEYSSESPITGDWTGGWRKGGSDSKHSYCAGPSQYNGTYAKYITKIKNFGAPYAWNDINGKNDVDTEIYKDYTDDPRQYPSYLSFRGWVRHEKDDDLANNNDLYFKESDEIDYDTVPEITSENLDKKYPTDAQARRINKIMVQHIADDINAGYFCTLSVRWKGTNTSGEQIADGAHIICVDHVDHFSDGSPRLVLLDSGGGYKYFDDLIEYWRSGDEGPDSVIAYIYEYYRMKAAGINSDEAVNFWDNGDDDEADANYNYVMAHKKKRRITSDDYIRLLDEDMPVDSADKITDDPTPGWAFQDGTPASKTSPGIISYSYKSLAPGIKYRLNASLPHGTEKKVPGTGRPGIWDPETKKIKTPAEPMIVEYGYDEIPIEDSYQIDLDRQPGKEHEHVSFNGEIGLYDPHKGSSPADRVVVPMKPRIILYGPDHHPFGVDYKLDPNRAYDTEDITTPGQDELTDPRHNNNVVRPATTQIISYGYTTVKPNATYKLDMNRKPGKENEKVTPGTPGLIDSHCSDPNKMVFREAVNDIVEYGPEPIPYRTEYRLDRSLEPDKTKTITPGVNGLRDPHATDETKRTLKEPVTEVIGYGPNRIPFKITYQWKEQLPEGKEIIHQPGKFGYIDQRHGNKKLSEPVEQIVYYGPKREPFKVEDTLDPNMPPNSKTVIRRGVVGLIDRDGKEIRKPVNQIEHHGPVDEPIHIDPDPTPEPPAPVVPPAPKPPVTPVTPVTPVIPVTPVQPVTPINPVIPVTPVTPVTPVQPVTPVTPVQPVTPVTPVQPTPVTPEHHTDEDIPFHVTYQMDESMVEGETRTIRPGVIGHKRDGKIIVEAVDAVVAYGPIHGKAPVIYRATTALKPGDLHVLHEGTDPLYDLDHKLVRPGAAYEAEVGTNGRTLTIPEQISFYVNDDMDSDVAHTVFKYERLGKAKFHDVFNAIDNKPAEKSALADAMQGKTASTTDVKGSLFDMSLTPQTLKYATDVTIDKQYVGLDNSHDVFVTMTDNGTTYRVPVEDNSATSFRIKLDHFGTMMFADKKPENFDKLPELKVTPKPVSKVPPEPITPAPPVPEPVDTDTVIYVTNDQLQRGLSSHKYIFDINRHCIVTNDAARKRVVVRQTAIIAFSREHDSDPSNDLVGDGHNNFYTVGDHPAGNFVKVAPAIRRIEKEMQKPHYSVPIPTLPAVHTRFAPVRNKRPYLPQHTVAIAARNQAPVPAASHPVTSQPQTTVPDSDRLLNHPPIKPSDTPSDKTTSDTTHKNTTGDYSVSKKNKNPQAKSVTPEAKPVKKHNSSFVWIVVTVFIILGIIVAAIIFLYKRSQDS